ncbi:MAG: DUF2953 domain-containing protein [Epulopiscium sp.]|nr:DUF2953 domain-containing protein [Candidatus Epulonipiscium sp.]
MEILHLFMIVLKFIGIIIAILLLLLLLLILIMLTVPIKYKLDLDKEEEIYAYTSFKWLFSLISINMEYHNSQELNIKYKILGIPIKPKKKMETRRNSRNSHKKIEKVENRKANNVTTNDVKAKKKSKGIKKDTKRKVKSKRNLGIKKLIKQIRSYSYKKDLLADTMVWIKDFIKRIAPNNLKIYLEIGKEDPADTGYIMATLSALYPLYYSFANIVGNYEKECLYVKIEADGKIALWQLIYSIIEYIRLESVKDLIKTVRTSRREKDNGRKTGK